MTTPPDKRILNPQQQQAVTHGTGPLLIIAGAGTGKTTVVTERIKHLIGTQRAAPDEILALTFTEKAAYEMEERVDQLVPYGYTQMWISTFHSFCDSVLRDEAVHIGLNPSFQLLTETDATQLFQKHLFSFDLEYFRPLGNPTKFVRGILQHISRLKDEDITPNQYIDWVKAKKATQVKTEEEKLEIQKAAELAQAYQQYEALKITEGVMDFSDLIANTLRLFRKRANIRVRYQQRFKYILIDEFQDTNIAQNELALLLAGKDPNITVVADDDQCLPGSSVVSTPTGSVPIAKIKDGDEVITAVGKGYLSSSKVIQVFRSKKRSRLITLITESGKKVTTTDNHKMFCMVPGKKFGSKTSWFYVYLMHRKDMGWRMGIADDLAQRLKLERSADKILAIKTSPSLEEARYWETVLSMKYQIPTYSFKPETNAMQLAKDFGINLDSYHYCLDGVVRGKSERVKIILAMCERRYGTKWAKGRLLDSPKVLHFVRVETSSKEVALRLQTEGIPFSKTKKGISLHKAFSDFSAAGRFAKKLQRLIHGVLEVRFSLGKRSGYARPAIIVPASNVLEGMYIPVKKAHEVVYEQVVERKEKTETTTLYDLEIERTHNFVADEIVVHNSIYRFRGAAVSNMLQFKKAYSKAKVVSLSQNYRSGQKILDRAYRLIQFNNPDRLEFKEHIDKKLTATRSQVGRVDFLLYNRVEHEADAVAQKIKNIHKHNQYQWSDFAILVRANNHANAFNDALARAGIPYQFLGPGQLFRQPEVQELIAYLHVLIDFANDPAFSRVLYMDYFALEPRDLMTIASCAKRYNISLFEACEVLTGIRSLNGASPPAISEQSKQTLQTLRELIVGQVSLLQQETAGQLLYSFLEKTGMMQKILDYQYPIDEKRANNIAVFFSKLKTYETEHQDASVPAVLDWIILASELGESPTATTTDWTDNNAVNILTVHSSKGLEFPVVFLVNLVSERFPTRRRKEQIPIPNTLIKEDLPEGDYHIQEERRLCYVGMTRARDRLYLTAAKYYGEGKREKKLSPFIIEALGDAVHKQPVASVDDQLLLFEYKKESTTSTSGTKIPKQLTIDYLSYSQLDVFRICPLHFKLKYLLKIPAARSPALSFGNSVHTTMRLFYQQVHDGQPVSKDTLMELFEQNWERQGYSSKKHEQKFLEQGRQYLAGYYAAHQPFSRVPQAIEQEFLVPITDGSRVLKIGGRMDRIDPTPHGIEIIDYKTGTAKTQKEVDRSLQLSMYALAATTIPQQPFGKEPKDITLSMYYFDNQQKVSTTRTAQQLEREKEKILAIAEAIEQSDLRCSGSALCTRCEYRLFCGMKRV